MADYDLIQFDPGNESHAGFVYDSFRRSMLECWPWREIPIAKLMDDLKRRLASPGVVAMIATPHSMPDSYAAFVAVRPPDHIVWAFTRYSMRRMGLATCIASDLGVDVGVNPVGLAYWTPAAARIMEKRPDYHIFFDLRRGYDV